MADNQNVKDRLFKYIEYKGISARKFSTDCGFSPNYATNISKGIPAEKVNKISVHFPDLNTVWLMTGEGPMLLTDATGSATDGMGEDGLKERITALERMLDERDARIAELEGRQEERLNAMQGNIDSLTSALNKALDLVKNSGK